MPDRMTVRNSHSLARGRRRRWLLFGFGVFASLGCGRRFTALVTQPDAAATASDDSEASTVTSVATSSSTLVVSTPSLPSDSGVNPSPQDAGQGEDPVSSDPDAATSDHSNVEETTSPRTQDVSSLELDASLTETSNETNTLPTDTTQSSETTSEPAHYPCNDGTFEAPREVIGLGFDNNLWGPGVSSDGQYLYFGHTGANEDLFVAKLAGVDSALFEPAQALTSLNTQGSEGTPFVTSNGLGIYFYATRAGGPGDRDLWHATRESEQAAFTEPELVPGVNGPEYDHLPWLSEDELTLCYTTLRDDGLGQSDIWMATRETNDAPFEDHRLVPGINSEAREDAVAFSPDGLTVFFSTDRATNGDLDIWHATRNSIDEEFSDAHAIAGLNSDAEDTNLALTKDGRHLYFSSGRSGQQRIWVSSRSCTPP